MLPHGFHQLLPDGPQGPPQPDPTCWSNLVQYFPSRNVNSKSNAHPPPLIMVLGHWPLPSCSLPLYLNLSLRLPSLASSPPLSQRGTLHPGVTGTLALTLRAFSCRRHCCMSSESLTKWFSSRAQIFLIHFYPFDLTKCPTHRKHRTNGDWAQLNLMEQAGLSLFNQIKNRFLPNSTSQHPTL